MYEVIFDEFTSSEISSTVFSRRVSDFGAVFVCTRNFNHELKWWKPYRIIMGKKNEERIPCGGFRNDGNGDEVIGELSALRTESNWIYSKDRELRKI